MREKIGLIQIDGVEPNLALMKCSKFYKDKGFDVQFIDLSTLGIKNWIASKVFVGGSGYNLKENLPTDIEEEFPDYEGFKLDHSVGFTSRGCIRNCDFCIVKKKEGMIKECSMEWIKHSKVLLYDNNFLASPLWKQKLEYFIKNKIKVSINQAMDIRLINKENASLLLKTKSYDRKFNIKTYYFAFDDIKLESVIREKVKLLVSMGFNPRWLMFYILIGYNSTHAEDLRRLEIIKELGCRPYIMRYNNRTDDRWLVYLDRYVNGLYFQFVPLDEYKGGILKEEALHG